MTVQNYLDKINEGYIFSDRTVSIDLKKFESGESNILLITGISGSGKSTLGRKLAKEYNAKYIASDFPCLTDNPHKKDPEGCFRNTYNRISKTKKTKYILEGVLVYYSCLDGWRPNLHPFFNKIKNEPMIILGTSILKTMYRNRKDIDQSIWEFIMNFLKFGKHYKEEMEPYIFFKKKREEVKGSIIKPYKVRI